MAPLVNNIWHHICVSWENVQGLWDVLVDGTVMAHGSDWGQTLSVRPGKLVVGLSQEVYGEGFTAGESFKGNIASLNIWSTKVTNSVIKEKANSCSYDLGNVIDWRTFRHGAHGNVKILSPQSCISHGKRKVHAAEKCTFESVINYVKLRTLNRRSLLHSTSLHSSPLQLHSTLLLSAPLHSLHSTPLCSAPLHPLHSTPFHSALHKSNPMIDFDRACSGI